MSKVFLFSLLFACAPAFADDGGRDSGGTGSDTFVEEGLDTGGLAREEIRGRCISRGTRGAFEPRCQLPETEWSCLRRSEDLKAANPHSFGCEWIADEN